MATVGNNLTIGYVMSKYDLERMFNIRVDEGNHSVFNLNETLYIDVPDSSLKIFIPDHPLHWSIISHRIYGTTRLAWLLMKINKISAQNMFVKVPPTMPVFYIETDDVSRLLNSLGG